MVQSLLLLHELWITQFGTVYDLLFSVLLLPLRSEHMQPQRQCAALTFDSSLERQGRERSITTGPYR
jgi:hypothetical protein